MIFLQLFWVYLKIGLFNFGGGYAMLPLIQHEIVEKHSWITTQEFTDVVAISQTTPGPIGINSATYVGYTAVLNAGYPPQIAILGSAVATISICIPSFALVLLASYYYARFRKNKYVAYAFLGLRPATVGLIAAASLLLMTPENFPDYKSILLFTAAFLLTWKLKIHPILTILLAALSGLLLY